MDFAKKPREYSITGMWGLFSKKRVYFDYASATSALPEALEAVSLVGAQFGNPGAMHAEGVQAAALLSDAREVIARELGCKARQVIFVSGGTEANNLAILGFARKLAISGKEISETHWVVSSIEHPSVLECFSEIERLGGTVSHVDPDERGVITPEVVTRALRKNTVFLSVQWANHEVGTIQPLRAISRAVKEHEEKHGPVIFHSDFGQAPLYISPQVHTLGVDIATLDSAKLYGPRGIGCVYLDNRVELAPILVGGGQERGLRAGTENVSLAAGFAKAFEIIGKERNEEMRRIERLRDSLWRDVSARIPDAIVNGSIPHALPHVLNISIPNISSEYITLALDHEGVAISTKSACKEGEARSHVVEALGGEEWRATNTLRFSLGRDTTTSDVEFAVEKLAKRVAKARA